MSSIRRGKAVENEKKYPFIVEVPVAANGLDAELNGQILVFHKSCRIVPRSAGAFPIWRRRKRLSNSLVERSTKQPVLSHSLSPLPLPWSAEVTPNGFIVRDAVANAISALNPETRITYTAAFSGGWAMALTPEHRAELEVLGPETVRVRLRSSDLVTVISGFKTPTTRSDLEGWLTEKRIEGESDRRWWWVFQVFVVAFLATAVVLLSLGVKSRLSAIYSFSSVLGWLAGAVTYFSWSILYARQRKKQQAVTWLLLGVSVAALVGFIWWLHYTVRFDLAPPAAALIEPMRPAPTVAPAPVTPVAPELNRSFTCTRNGDVT